MTDFEKLLEGGCSVDTLIYISDDIDEVEGCVLSALVTHKADNESDNTELWYSSEIDLDELLEITGMDKEDLFEALNSLEEKGYIVGNEESGNIQVSLKSSTLNSKFY